MLTKSFVFVVLVLAACSDPVRVTGVPNDNAATSGTLGSSKAENHLPPVGRDTIQMDSVLHDKQ